MTPAIAARDLRFAYAGREGGFSLHVPSWEVAAGARVGLFGPSGCGKSTLLGLIAGLLAADGGSLRVGDVELVGMPDGARRRHRLRNLGFVFQDFPLVEYLDALENVLLPYRVGGLRLTGEVRERAAGLLGELDLGDKLRRRPARLSQGERQRVALARALITQPRVVLADEPTTGLDPDRTEVVLDLLTRLVSDRGVTLVLVSHDRALVDRLDRAWDVSDWAREPS